MHAVNAGRTPETEMVQPTVVAKVDGADYIRLLQVLQKRQDYAQPWTYQGLAGQQA